MDAASIKTNLILRVFVQQKLVGVQKHTDVFLYDFIMTKYHFLSFCSSEKKLTM